MEFPLYNPLMVNALWLWIQMPPFMNDSARHYNEVFLTFNLLKVLWIHCPEQDSRTYETRRICIYVYINAEYSIKKAQQLCLRSVLWVLGSLSSSHTYIIRRCSLYWKKAYVPHSPETIPESRSRVSDTEHSSRIRADGERQHCCRRVPSNSSLHHHHISCKPMKTTQPVRAKLCTV